MVCPLSLWYILYYCGIFPITMVYFLSLWYIPSFCCIFPLSVVYFLYHYGCLRTTKTGNNSIKTKMRYLYTGVQTDFILLCIFSLSFKKLAIRHLHLASNIY